MTAVTPGREESLPEIVERLRINWSNHSEKIGDPLMRLINSLSSCADVNLSGIDRDLIVYALAFARLADKPTDEGADIEGARAALSQFLKLCRTDMSRAAGEALTRLRKALSPTGEPKS